MDRLMQGVLIGFEGLSRADAGRAAQELRRALVERVGHELAATIGKDDPDSQDAGSSLQLLFATAAALEIAKGIRAWLTRRSDIRDGITITTVDGLTIVAKGNAALDVAALAQALERRPARPPSLILFLAANPSGISPLALDAECAAVERELKLSSHRDDFEFRSKWAVSVDELARHVLELKPTVIHFSGHGTQRQGGGIVLRDEAGAAQVVPGRALGMLVGSPTPKARVVVLNACYSDDQAQVLRQTVDCVVGMTGAIGDEAALSFAVGFYRGLGNRLSVFKAVDHAVATLAAKRLPDELLPRCHARDGIDASQLVLGMPD